MGKQEIRDNYIKAKERLANCEKFGIKVICSYIKEGKSETCLEYHNYRSLSPRELEEISDMAIRSSLLLNAE